MRVTEADGKVVDGSTQLVLRLPTVTSTWHMGGALRFAPDGKLFVAVGNHEDIPQPVATANSQNLTVPMGKILRIFPSGSVPSDNPFVGSDAYPAIWAYGFRNPFSFDIQPTTGRIFVGDVGQSTWEEIDELQKGGNYGWPAIEGPGDAGSIKPIYSWNHNDGGCAVTGGAWYNPGTVQFPQDYVGKFLFEDYCLGTISALDPDTAEVKSFVSGIVFPTNLAVAPDGSLYYLARHDDAHEADGLGTLSKIIYNASTAPRIAREPVSQTSVIGATVTFKVEVQGADSLQWQRDSVDIAGATGTSYTLMNVSASDNGAKFSVVAKNESGSTTTSAATLTVTSNQPPVAMVTGPLAKAEYAPGDMLSFTATASDAEDGTLPNSAFTWQVDFHHDTHSHPLVPATPGSSQLSFTVPDFEATEANTWIRVNLTAVDSGGASHSVYRDVFPATQLTSLPAVGTVINGFGPLEIDSSNGEDGAHDGRPLSIGSIPFLKGFGVAAPSEVRFDLGAHCSGQLLADIGVDDEVGDNGSVVFQVFLDNTLVYDSGVKKGVDPRTDLSVDVKGGRALRLVVSDAGDGTAYDHADWAAARITGCVASGVSDLVAYDSENAADWSIQTNLQVGNAVYGDRSYTFTQLPGGYLGATWIRTANDSKWYAGPAAASFKLGSAQDVIVAIDDLGVRPSWIDASWTATGDKLGTLEVPGETRTFSAYRKNFPAGSVSLGLWVQSPSMYVVIVPGVH
jgi:hypothetical protein